MSDDKLTWEIKDTQALLHTPVFDVLEQAEVSAIGIAGDYVAMRAPDWVMVIPEYRDSLILVRQWRHAAETLSLEFPGGVVDSGESPQEAAARELKEETGFAAGELIHLGTVSPNPALFKNRYHVYLARELEATGQQHLDADELLTYEQMSAKDIICRFGEGEFTHALMGTALLFYLRAQTDCSLLNLSVTEKEDVS